MIAERPTKTRAAENTEEDLFEGLSFPEVPTAPIAPSAYMQPTVTQKPPEVLQRPESRPSQVDVESAKVVAPAVMEAPKRPTNLSALYATEVRPLNLAVPVSLLIALTYIFLLAGCDV
jgi:hypothetical protein